MCVCVHACRHVCVCHERATIIKKVGANLVYTMTEIVKADITVGPMTAALAQSQVGHLCSLVWCILIGTMPQWHGVSMFISLQALHHALF